MTVLLAGADLAALQKTLKKETQDSHAALRINGDVHITATHVYFPNLCFTRAELQKIWPKRYKPDDVFVLRPDGFSKAALFDGHSRYRLAYQNGVLLEIDGIHMHLTSKVAPVEDAKRRATALHIREGDAVLDVGTGLGYSAAATLERGARKVVSLEKNEAVLELARLNHASRLLFTPPVEILIGPAERTIRALPSHYFDAVCHDPPRFTHAGELYGADFYGELARVSKPGARLYHYVGSPGAKAGKNLAKGVAQRLRENGFRRVRWNAELQGFLAERAR